MVIFFFHFRVISLEPVKYVVFKFKKSHRRTPSTSILICQPTVPGGLIPRPLFHVP